MYSDRYVNIKEIVRPLKFTHLTKHHIGVNAAFDSDNSYTPPC